MTHTQTTSDSHAQIRPAPRGTEKQDWARGWAALKKFTEREHHTRVPYGHKEGAQPLGKAIGTLCGVPSLAT